MLGDWRTGSGDGCHGGGDADCGDCGGGDSLTPRPSPLSAAAAPSHRGFPPWGQSGCWAGPP